MRQIGKQGSCLVLRAILVAVLLPSSVAAARVGFEGVSFNLPAEWTAAKGSKALSLSRGALRADGALWVREGRSANLNVTALSRYMEVSSGRLSLARAEIERGARKGSKGMETLQVETFRFVRLGGLPAYRMESRLCLRGETLRQLTYVISGRKTFVVTFSTCEAAHGQLRDEFETVGGSIQLENRAGVLEKMPAWFCGGIIVVVAALGAAFRRRD